MALLNDIYDSLKSQGVVEAGGWRCFIGVMPDTPDTAVALFNGVGEEPEQNWAYDRPSFQVRVRAAVHGHATALAKMQAIFEALHSNETAIGSSYVYVYAVQSNPLPLGEDVNRRPEYVLNFRCAKSR